MGEGKRWLVALAIAGVGFWLRLDDLGVYWVNGDEGFYDFIAHAPFALARESSAPADPAPLYFGLLRAVATGFDGFVWLRVPSLIGGVAGIFAMYLLGRELAGEVAGLAAAALLAFSPGAVELSSSIRPPALASLMLIAGLFCVFRYLRTRRRGDLCGYVLASAAALLLDYGTFVVLAALTFLPIAAAVSRRVRGRDLRDLFLAQLGLATAAAVVFVHIGDFERIGSVHWVDGEYGRAAIERIAKPGDAWRVFLDSLGFWVGPRAAFAAAFLLLGSVVACAFERRAALVALCLAAPAIAIGLSASGPPPFAGARISFYVAPIAFATLGCGAAHVAARGRLAVGIAAGIAVALLAAAPPLAALLGSSPERPVTPPEVRIPRSEVASLRDAFAQISASPGIVLMDLETAYRLSPMLRAAGAVPDSEGASAVHAFAWDQRRLLVAEVRWFDDGTRSDGSSRYLTRLLRAAAQRAELAELVDRDAVVVAVDAGRTRASVERLSSGEPGESEWIAPLAETPHFSIFRFDAKRYRDRLNERRDRLRNERGRRPLGFE